MLDLSCIITIYNYITLPPSTELLDRINVVYMFKYLLEDCVSKENSTYVDLTTTTLSKRLTMHLAQSAWAVEYTDCTSAEG